MQLFPNWWRKSFLTVEAILAALAMICLFAWLRYGNAATVLDILVQKNRGQVYGTLASIFGSLLGFVITALSVVLGLSSSDRLKVLRTSSYYKQLWEVFISAIRVLAFTTIGWLLALFFDRDGAPKSGLIVVCLALTLFAAFRLARCIWVLERIVEVLTVKTANGAAESSLELSQAGE